MCGVSQYVVENVPLPKVHTGKRRREKIGSLAGLKSSLERVGQIHPITVRPNGQGFELVAGERRLRAAEALGWSRIRARVGRFTDEQLRDIELDENVVRLDLSDFEASKARLRQIEAAEGEAEAERISAQDGQKRRGRPNSGDSAVARRTGLSRQEVQRTKRHVETADAFPTFQGANWKRSQVIAASEAIEALSKSDQATAVEMIAEPGVDPKSAVRMLETLAEKPRGERAEILDLYRSGDSEKRSLAKTRAAQLPPMPDPRYTMTQEMLRLARSCIKSKQDGLRDAYRFVADEIEKIVGELDEAYEKAKKG